MGCFSSSTVAPDLVVAFHEKLEFGEKLGRGNFAQVRACRLHGSDVLDEFAVKALSLRKRDKNGEWAPDPRRAGLARVEVQLWRQVGDHTNIVRLVDVCIDPNLCIMVMERCGASLLSFLQAQRELHEPGLCKTLIGALRAIEHCHSARVVHRDVKAENLLVSKGVVKLCDFGLSTNLPDGQSLHGSLGTAPYMSPEMTHEAGHDEKTDIWSFGVLLYLFLYGSFPYWPQRRTRESSKRLIAFDGLGPSFTPQAHDGCDVSPEAEAFVRALLCFRASERPSAEDALQMEWPQGEGVGRSMQQPSLRPALDAAVKSGAFEIMDISTDVSGVDSLLAALHPEVLADLKPSRNSTPCTTSTTTGNSRESSIQSRSVSRDRLFTAVICTAVPTGA